MREWHAVPCMNATRAQVIAQVHLTLNDDRLCDRCASKSGTGTALPVPYSPTPLLEVGEPGPRVSVSTAVPAGSSLPDEYVAGRSTPVAPLRSRLAWSAPTVLEVSTASRGGSTFDDGFLSNPSSGEQQLQREPQPRYRPLEGRAAAHQST